MGQRYVARCARMIIGGLILLLLWWPLSTTAPTDIPLTSAQVAPVRVPILVYHAIDDSGVASSVTAQQLDAQCRWLVENGYTAITLWRFWRAARGMATLPPKPVILTNDDGDPSVVTFAAILRRHGLFGAYFINNVSALSRREIRLLARRGSVEAHTVSHVALSGLDHEEQRAEIARNMRFLQRITGQRVRFLAWPYGDVNESAVQAASAAGIVAAFGLGGGAAELGALDPYHIPRIMIFADDDLATFAAKVSGR